MKHVLIKKTVLFISIVGAIAWGLYGGFQFNLIGWICGSPETMCARILYGIVGLSGLIGLRFLLCPSCCKSGSGSDRPSGCGFDSHHHHSGGCGS